MWGIEKGRSRDAHTVLGGNDIILKLGCNNLLLMKCGIRNPKAYIDRNNGNFLYFILFPFISFFGGHKIVNGIKCKRES